MRLLTAILMLFTSFAFANVVTPTTLTLTNQFGEVSQNWVQGQYLPLPTPKLNLMVASGVVTPTALTLNGIAGTGSLYINTNPQGNGSAKLFINIGVVTSPNWVKVGP